MGSHHFIGTGRLSAWLEANATDERLLSADGRRLVEESGLAVVGEKYVSFDGDGTTLVWVLAESHLVLHVWKTEGFATVDLHVCDYKSSNAGKARSLVAELTGRWFATGSAHWRELEVEHPSPLAAAH